MTQTLTHILWTTFLAFFGASAPGVLFNINRNKLLYAGIGGSLGWFFYVLLQSLGINIFISAFIGAFLAGIYSEFMARVKRAPAMMFFIPAIIPLVPGYTAYCAVLYFIQHEYNLAKFAVFRTAGMAVALCFGLLFSSVIMIWLKAKQNNNIKEIKG